MDREKPNSTMMQKPAPHNDARAGFGVAPILYMLGLIGVGAGLLFSSYSQSVKGNIQMTNSFSVKSDLEAAATTLAATSVLGATDPGTLCPPQGGVDTVGSNCVSAPDKMIEIYPTMNVTLPDAHLPTNYVVSHASGSPVEVGVFTNSAGIKQLDPWGHYYIYCRWESQGNSSNPAIQILSAGSTGVLNTSCGAATASTSPDNYALSMNASVAVNRSAVWQTGTIGSSTPDIYYGTVGHQLTVDANGNLTVPGNATVNGSYTSPGNITTTAGNLSAVGGAFSGSVGVTGDLSAENGAVATASGGTLTATNGAFAVNSGGVISAASGTFLVGSGGTVSAANGNFAVDNTGSLTIGTGGFTVAAASGNTSVGGLLNVVGILSTNVAANVGSTVASTGTSASLFSVGKKVGLLYPFAVDQAGNVNATSVTAGSFNGNLSGSVTGGTISGISMTNSGDYTSSSGNITIGGIVTASGFSGTLSLGGGGSGVTLSGVVPIANGGTGESTAPTAITNLFTGVTGLAIIDGSNLASGTVTSSQLNNVVTAGVYNSVTVTGDGRVVSGSYTAVDATRITDGLGDSVSVGTGAINFGLGGSGIGAWTNTGLMIGTTLPTAQDKLDVYGNEAIGTPYAGTVAAPINGLIVAGSVGIGTSSPTSALSVNGTITATNFSGSGAGLTSIGTTAITGILAPVNGGTGVNNGNNTLTLPMGGITLGSASLAGQVAYYSGTNTLAGTTDIYISGTNVGIGTASPATSLDLSQRTDALALPSGSTGQEPIGINGMIRYNTSIPAIEAYVNSVWSPLASASSLGSGITLGSSTAVTNPARYGDVTTGLYSDAAGTVEISSAGTKTFSSNSTQTIIPVGNVGIGVISPGNALQVYNATAAQALFNGYSVDAATADPASGTILLGNTPGYQGRIDYSAAHNTTWNFDNTYVSSGAITQFRMQTAGTPITALVIEGNGNVGIGGVPSTLLSLTAPAGATAPTINFTLTSGYGADGARILANATSAAWNASYIDFQTHANGDPTFTDDMVIKAGNIGIGTTTPITSLDLSYKTDAVALPVGTTGTRPSTSINGMIRYNSANGKFEAYQSGAWQDILTSAIGNGLTLGTALTALNPTKSGDNTTGLYSDAAGTVEIASSGIKSFSNNSTYTLIPAGSVGIGTTSPLARLTVSSNTSALQSVTSMVDTSFLVGGADGHRSRVLIDSYGTGTAGTASIMTFRTARGTAASPSANMLGDTLANISVQGYGATAYQSATKAAILVGAAENWTDSSQADYIAFDTVPSGSANTSSEKMRIDSTGNVGIGSTIPRVSLDLSLKTDALSLPAGTTGQEPVGPNGMIRYNSTTPALEAYVNNAWTSVLTSSSLGSGLMLGTALTALNPTKSGDTTTGLYSDAAGTVEIASAGTKTFSSNSTATLFPVGSVAIGAITPSYPLSVTSSSSAIAYFRSTGALNASVLIDNSAGGNQSAITFADAGSGKWQIGKNSNNTFFIYDTSNAANFLTVSTSGLLQMGESSQLRLPATGNVGIGVTAPASILDATGNIPSGGTGYNFTSTSLGSSTTESGVSSSLTYSPSTAPVGTSTIAGLNSAVTSSSANANSFSALLGSNTSVSYSNAAGTLGTAKGMYASAKNAAAGTITSAYGLQAQTVNNATGSILSAAAGQFAVLNNSTGSISNAYGVNIATPVNAGTVGLTYGLYINSQTAGTQTTAPYGVYQVGAADRNYFAGNIGIGSTSPIASLDLSQKTDAVALPVGTTGTRPGTSINGMLRYNSTNGKFEAYQSGAWQDILTSAISNGLTLGTALTALNPTKSGDTTTGLYSDATSTVEIAGGGAQLLSLSPSYHLIPIGSVGIGSATPHAPLEIGNVGLTALFGSASAGFSAYVGFNESLGAPRATVGYNGTTNNAVLGGGAGKGIEFDVNAGFGSGQAMVIGSAGQVGIGSLSPIVSLDLSQKTDAVALPIGTTGTRPSTSINGMLRYNSTNGKFEAYQAGTWQDILTSAVSNGLTLGTALTALNPTKSGDTTTGLYSDATSTVEIAGGATQLMSMSPTYHLIPVGSVGINIATPDSKLEVSGTVPYSGSGNSEMVHVIATSNNAGSGNEAGLYVSNTVSPPSAPVSSYNPSALSGGVTTASANLNSNVILNGATGNASNTYTGTSLAALYGFSGVASNNSTGTIANTIGVRAYSENISTGTITNATGASINIKNDTSGVITTGTGLMVGSPTNGGTIGSTYGLYINSQTIGTQTNAPYALYQSGATDKNYFAGPVNIGNTTAGTVEMLVGTSGNPYFGLINNSLVAQNNPLVQAGDEQIVFSSSGQNTGNLVIGPWSSTSAGLRMTSTGKIGIGSSLPRVTLDISQATDALALPSGTTGQEPIGPNGMIRYNSSTPAVEAYVSNSWQSLLTSASLGSTTISLGTSATTANPAKSGDVTTGFYSDAAGTVEIASAGTKTFSSSSTYTLIPVGSVGIGASPGYPLVVSSATSAGLGLFRSTGALNAIVQIDNAAGGNQTTVTFQDAGSTKWQIGKASTNSFFIYDVANATNFLTVSTTGLLQMGESSQLRLPSTGNVGIGVSAPASILDATGNIPSGGTGYNFASTSLGSSTVENGVASTLTYSPTTAPVGTSTISGINSAVTSSSSNANSFSGLIGLNNAATYSNATGTLGNAKGIYTAAKNAAAGTISAAYAFQSQAINSATGAITSAYAGQFSIQNNSTGTITNAFGVNIAAPVNAGSLGSTYGLYISPQTAGTQTNAPYAIYQGGASDKNYFAGTIGIGSTLPVSSLDLSQETDAVAMPAGTTGQRPTGINGMMRYNNSLASLEGYVNGAWTALLTSTGSSSLTLGTSLTALNPAKSGDSTTGLYSDATSTVEIAGAGSQLLSMSPTAHIIPIGSVGIGVTAPLGAMDISNGNQTLMLGADTGATTRTNATQKIARIGVVQYTNTNTPFAFANVASTVANNTINIGGGTAGLDAATLVSFYTAANQTTSTGTERMRVGSGGLVAIGTTSQANMLDVFGGVAIGSATNFAGTTAAPTNGMIVAGSVGIGTAAPTAALHVSGSGALALIGDGGSTSYMGFTTGGLAGYPNGRAYFGYDALNTNAFMQAAGGKGIEFAVNNSTVLSGIAMVISSAGQVGIGSTAPRASLDLSLKTDAISLPVGTTGQEPATAVNGMVRYNTTTPALEAYVNNSWSSLLTNASLGSTTIALGTSAITTNPAKSGDVTTGLYSDAAGTVEISSAGTKTLSSSSTYTLIPSGSVGINTPIPDSRFQITGTIGSSGTTSALMHVNATGANAGSATEAGIYVNNTVTPASAPAASYNPAAIVGTASTSSANVNSNTTLQGVAGSAGSGYIGTSAANMYGLVGTAANNAAGSISKAVGVRAYSENVSTGTISSAFGSSFSVKNDTTGIIGNAYGAYITNAANATGTINNNYGLYLENQTVGTNNYTLYSVGGTNYFGGNVGIGTTAPAVSLDLSYETDAIAFPVGTTGQRPSGANGMVRYNSSTPGLEAYVNGSWMSLLSSGGASTLTLGTSTAATNPSRSGDLTTGFYTAGSGKVDVSIAGVQSAEFSTTGINITTGGLNIAGVNGISFPPDTTPGGSIAIGSGSLASQPFATGTGVNIAIGYQVMGGTTSAAANIGLGFQSLYHLTSGATNIAIGNLAADSLLNGSLNVAIGFEALAASQSGNANVAISPYAANAYTGDSIIAIGYSALSTTTGSGNAAIGTAAGLNITGGTNNTIFGNSSMQGVGASPVTGSANTVIGYDTMANAITTAAQNTVVGATAANALTTGASNTVLGYSVATTNLKTGSNNILIGTSNAVDTPAAGTNNFLNIANLIYGTNIGTAGQGGVGIGSTSPRTSLDLSQQTDALALPAGTTGQEPTGVNGMIRYNKTTPAVEAYVSNSWQSLLTVASLGSTTISLGTSATTTNPSKTGDVTTGLYSDAAGTVEISSAGIKTFSSNLTYTIMPTGSVGIGSSLPAKTLDVVGTARISTSLVTPLIYPVIDSTAAIQFDKADGLSNVLTIDTANSRIGIGTSVANNTLEIGGGLLGALTGTKVTVSNGVANSGMEVGQGPTARGRMLWLYNATAANAYMTLGVSGGTNPLVLQDGGGNVGIGTTTPQNKLDVYGGMAVGSGFAGTTTAPAGGMITSGSVGVGVASPAAAVDVAGALKVAGSSAACGPSTIGSMHYNSIGGYMEICQ